MANRNWRSGGYQTFNQILTPMSYYPQPVNYPVDRKPYGGRGGYRDDNPKRDRKDFQPNRRERFSPNTNKRRSPYQRSQESNENYRKDFKKSRPSYEVKVPHLSFDVKELSTSSLKFRYPKMSIPSDFFHADLNAKEAFPLYRPLKLGHHCEFQVINKDVDEPHNVVSEPEDVNYKYSAKVMLMTSPFLPNLYKLACHMPIDEAATNTPRYGLYKHIHFLVGSKGKNEPTAIGGPWSPSLDGPNPEEDPNVLVKTAIRTCKSLTGIDLSRCKKWYKFLDIKYYRSSGRKVQNVSQVEKKEDDIIGEEVKDEATVETVTIFVPDVWSCIPTDEEWSDIKDKYEKKLQSLLFPKVEVPIEDEVKKEDIPEETKKDIVENEEVANDKVDEVKEKMDTGVSTVLDLNQMKVTELRTELLARGLDGKGLKLQLIQRLQEAIDKEKESLEVKESPENKVPESVIENHVQEQSNAVQQNHSETNIDAAVSQLPEKEQKRLKWLYRVNEKPSIMVHPTKTITGELNLFNVMNLERLSECHSDDQKEHSFEVSLFVEQFIEMIQRDAAFTIYKALIDLPDISKDTTSVATESEPKVTRLETDPRKSKMIVDMELLFAFFAFDNENCGYLRDHDLEGILHCLGLNLSRSQAKKLMSRLPIKKGNVIYRDIVERDVVEGSTEDLAILKTAEPNIDRLVELSHGNRAFFDEADTHGHREGSLALLDSVTATETRLVKHQVQLTLLSDELKRIKAIEESAGDVAIHLKDNIKKIGDKLALEKESMAKLSSVAQVYSGLLRSARDHMDASIQEITSQFDAERAIAEKIKEEADRAKAEADRLAKEEAERAAAAANVVIDFTEDAKMEDADL